MSTQIASFEFTSDGSRMPIRSIDPVSRLQLRSAEAFKRRLEVTFDKTSDDAQISPIETQFFFRPKVSPLCQVHNPQSTKETFEVLQKWEGYVQSVNRDDGCFLARLVNKKIRDANDEEADISIDDIADDDLDLLKPGAVFYWSIGYSIVHGTKQKASRIRFRRLFGMTSKVISDAKQWGSEMERFFSDGEH
jgi:hypothetical protein